MDQKKADHATRRIPPVAVCEAALVLDRLVVTAAEVMPLLLPILVGWIPGEASSV